MADGEKDDGGQAFPTPPNIDRGTVRTYGKDGMSLRDWFAGQALSGVMNSIAAAGAVPEHVIVDLFGERANNVRREQIAAALAYRMADAMLEARKIAEAPDA